MPGKNTDDFAMEVVGNNENIVSDLFLLQQTFLLNFQVVFNVINY